MVLAASGGCMLCPRECGANRQREAGYCGAGKDIYVARAAAHMWEEPCLSGEKGSGAVFFSGCPLHCIYCQNHEISSGGKGRALSVPELSRIFLELQTQGLHNINLVTPTHYRAQIAEALRGAKVNIPVVYNCGGYEGAEGIAELKGLVDVYMPDFKYFYPKTAACFSRAPDYPDVAKKAIRAMFLQVGKPLFEKGLMKKGLLVRHLVLPGHILESKRIISWLYESFADGIYISIMNQYTPVKHFPDYPELNRSLTISEYRQVVKHAEKIGVVNAFIQEGKTASESFIPDFGE